MRRPWLGSLLLFLFVAGAGSGLAAWKHRSVQEANAAAASQPEPMESVTVAVAEEREYAPTASAIGTVLALRSITLRNELPGTVASVALVPGAIVEAGTVLVALDVSVEEAELAAQEAQVVLAEKLLERMERANQSRAASEMEIDRARAERDVARAQIARTEAIIERKTIGAPFRARVGLADVHVGQYLVEGTLLTTLQGVDDAVHVDFAVAQQVAARLGPGDSVEVSAGAGAPPLTATIVAVDARVDPMTRNAGVRARIDDAAQAPAPGAAVRVRVPDGAPRRVVVVPASALRKGPAGDHVFVVAPDGDGRPRAQVRPVESGPMLDERVILFSGLAAGEQVAASGSFKLRDGALLAIADPSPAPAGAP